MKTQAKMTVILKDTVIRNNEASSKILPSDNVISSECNNESKDYDDFGSFVSAESSPNKV